MHRAGRIELLMNKHTRHYFMREVGEEGKFAVDVKSLLMGEPKTAALGLEVFMGSAPGAAGSADRIDAIVAELIRLQTGLLDQAERHNAVIMPGFTHLQTAQPVTYGHHMLAWYEMLVRDEARFVDCRKRINQLPLGAAALAGTTFPIDRQMTADLLDFDGVCANSLDAVSDRVICVAHVHGRRHGGDSCALCV